MTITYYLPHAKLTALGRQPDYNQATHTHTPSPHSVPQLFSHLWEYIGSQTIDTCSLVSYHMKAGQLLEVGPIHIWKTLTIILYLHNTHTHTHNLISSLYTYKLESISYSNATFSHVHYIAITHVSYNSSSR